MHVEQHDRRPVLDRQRDGLHAVLGDADDLELRIRVEYRSEQQAVALLVVGVYEANRLRIGRRLMRRRLEARVEIEFLALQPIDPTPPPLRAPTYMGGI